MAILLGVGSDRDAGSFAASGAKYFSKVGLVILYSEFVYVYPLGVVEFVVVEFGV